LAIAIIFVGALVLLLALITGIGLQALNQGQSLIIALKETVKGQDLLPFHTFLERLDLDKIVGTLQTSLSKGLGIVQGIFSSIFTGIFGAVISLYMLIDGEKLWQSFLILIPVAYRDRFAQSFRQSFLGFIRGQLLLMLFLTSTTFLSLLLLQVNYSLILAIIMGIVDVIPGIGATLGILILGLLVFTSQGGAIALKVAIALILLQQIQENYIRPKVMGKALELNPVILFLALFIGQRIAGLLGVFLSIPIAGMISIWIGLAREESKSSQDEITQIPDLDSSLD
jgi:hypothetical protein